MDSVNLKTSTPLVYRRYDSGYGSYGKGTDSKSNLVELSPIRKQPPPQSNLSAILRVCGILSPVKKSLFRPLQKVSKKLFTSSSDLSSGYGSDDPSESSSFVTTEPVQNENLSKKCIFSTDENCNIIYDCVNSEKLYQPFKYICKEGTDDEELKSNESNNNTSFLGSFCNQDFSLSSEENESKIDFISELDIRNCTGVLSGIFSYLSGEDLTNANLVNKQWRDTVLNDRRANEKRKNYIANKKNSSVGPNKENKFQGFPLPERDHKSAFTCVINISSETSLLDKHDSFYGKFDSFLEEVKTIKEKECLMKCPKCQYPSKPHGGLKFSCTRKLCQHEFCKKCLSPFFKKHACSAQELDVKLPNIVIGSKKSKKNLRRL